MEELKNDIGDKVGGAVKDVNKNWAVMATGVKSVVDLVGQATAAAGQLLTVLKSAANQQAVSGQFDRMGLSIGRIRDAAKGTISDGALKQWSIQLAQAGRSSTDIEKLVNLSAKLAASGLGAAKGIFTTADALEVLADSVVGASDSDLEKFGVLFDMPAATKKFAAEMKLLGDDVDKTVESQAVFNFITGEMAERVKDVKVAGFATDIQKAETAITNWSDSAKILFVDSLRQWPAILDDAGRGFRYLSQSMSFFVVGTDAAAAIIESTNKHLKAQGVALENIPELLLTTADKTALLAKEQATAAEKADILARSYRALAESARELQRLAFRESTAEDKEFFTKGAAPGPLGLQKMMKTPTRGRGGGRRKKDLGRFGALTGPIDEILENARAENEAWDRLQAAHYKATQELLEEQHDFKVRNKKEWDAELEEMEKAHLAIMEGFNKRSLDRAFATLTDAGEILGEGWAGVGGRIAEGLGPATEAIGGIIDQTQTLIENGASASDAWGEAAIGMAKVTANFVGDVAESEGLRAMMMAAIETAEAWKSFAAGEYASGAMHVVAAGLYTAASIQAFQVAGSKGKGGRAGGGATARRAGGVPSANASMGGGPGESAQGQMITINYNGTTFAAREQFDREVRHANTRVNANQSIPMWSQA